MARIGDAPSGENAALTGTEKVPLSGSKWALVSRWVAYLSGEGTLATKSYADTADANVAKRNRVRAATTANIVIATALNNADTLDGVTLATGDLVLVKDQTSSQENGIYVVGTSPARFAEYNTYNEHPGSIVVVAEGTVNADTLWICTSNDGGVLDTTAIAFLQPFASGVYTPTRSAETNLDANVTMNECQWMRVNKTVTVSGRFTADPTTNAVATSFEITLPIASNLGAAEDVAGVAFCGGIAGQGAEIIGVAANDTAKVQWVAGDTTSKTWSFIFAYQVI